MEQWPENLSKAASLLLHEQLGGWPLAARNYAALESVHLKHFTWEGQTIRVQFNPARIVSSGAKVDARSIRERRCFLCPNHLPAEQLRLPFGARYLVLCNPFPIFPEHFTIPAVEHVPQLILPQFADFLAVVRAMNHYTLFYNGPRCGASAPDHAHFQAVTQGLMPLDEEVKVIERDPAAPCVSTEPGEVIWMRQPLRQGFLLKANSMEKMERLFRQVYALLPIPEGEVEPMMNLFGWYREEGWLLALLPRRRHRPWQYGAEGAEHLLSSPGAADMGGLFITPLAEDFEKINPDLLQDVYHQVGWSEEEAGDLFARIKDNS